MLAEVNWQFLDSSLPGAVWGIFCVFCQCPSAWHILHSLYLWETGCERYKVLQICFAKWVIARARCPTPTQQTIKPKFFPRHFQQRGKVLGGRQRSPFTQPLKTFLYMVVHEFSPGIKRNLTFFLITSL